MKRLQEQGQELPKSKQENYYAFVEKFAVTKGEQTFILKYNLINQQCVLGGYSKLRIIIEDFLSCYFRLEQMPEIKFAQRNKIRFEFKYPMNEYRKSVNLVRDEKAVIFEQIKTHGRMI